MSYQHGLWSHEDSTSERLKRHWSRNAIEERKKDYQLCFGSPAGKKVLEDLALFCFISTLDEDAYARGDPNETMMRLGCQKVFRHISMHLSLTTENLMSIYFPVRTRSDDGNSTGYPGGPSSSP